MASCLSPRNWGKEEKDGSKWTMQKINLCPRNHIYQWIWISPQLIWEDVPIGLGHPEPRVRYPSAVSLAGGCLSTELTLRSSCLLNPVLLHRAQPVTKNSHSGLSEHVYCVSHCVDSVL